MNSNGSSLGNPGTAGYGGLFWSSDGAWVACFFGHVPGADNLCMELLALPKGLLLAWSMNF